MDILDKAKAYVENLYSERVSDYYCYHSIEHTRRVVAATVEIAQASGLKEGEIEILQLAAWFHDTGFAVNYLANEPAGAGLAEVFLTENNYPIEKINVIKQLILATELTYKPTNLFEEIIRDADLIHLGRTDFLEINNLLRKEWKLVIDREMNDKAWLELSLEFQKFHRFNTLYASEKYGPVKQSNIKELEELVEITI